MLASTRSRSDEIVREPWECRADDEAMKLSAIGTLLPYHTHVDIASAVAAFKRMIDDARQGLQIH